jgi:2-polyprenyl-6-hydroxyphenyl methylase/3-demethylubiquinone-9 3-methyltransferase
MLDKSNVTNNVKNSSHQEIARFDDLADQWWDENGKYKTALAFNKARLGFIIEQIQQHFANRDQPSDQINILDVGSGGGLISEPLAEKGYTVTGIDASGVSVEVAKRHALYTGVSVTYKHCLANDLDPLKQQFDVVINAEVVEHVPDQQALIEHCCSLVKPGGMLVLATLNRTVKSWVIAILGAEYVMRYLPIGTHSWSKFVKPQELINWASENDCDLIAQTGMSLNPFSGNWYTTKSLAVNYVQSFRKL